MPRVTVVMPLMNARPFVEAAIRSITTQTLGDLELVIVENGSRDGSRDCARQAAAADRRIRLIEHDEPLGAAAAANLGTAAACASLVARMDHDDVSHPTRLEDQLAALEAAPGAVAVGTLANGIDERSKAVRPSDRWCLFNGSRLPPFPHGSVMYRREAFERVGGYRSETGAWEDVDLFLRMSRLGDILVLPRTLYSYRYHGSSVTGMSVGHGSLVQMWTCLDALHRTGSYEHLLGAGDVEPIRGALRRAVRHRDGVRLWAGLPPGTAPSFAEIARTDHTAAARLFWLRGVWHERRPGSLRCMLRLSLRVRNGAARLLHRDARPRRWNPGP